MAVLLSNGKVKVWHCVATVDYLYYTHCIFVICLKSYDLGKLFRRIGCKKKYNIVV